MIINKNFYLPQNMSSFSDRLFDYTILCLPTIALGAFQRSRRAILGNGNLFCHIFFLAGSLFAYQTGWKKTAFTTSHISLFFLSKIMFTLLYPKPIKTILLEEGFTEEPNRTLLEEGTYYANQKTKIIQVTTGNSTFTSHFHFQKVRTLVQLGLTSVPLEEYILRSNGFGFVPQDTSEQNLLNKTYSVQEYENSSLFSITARINNKTFSSPKLYSGITYDTRIDLLKRIQFTPQDKISKTLLKRLT